MGKGANRLPTPTKLRMPSSDILGVSPRAITFVVERVRAQTAS